MVEQRVQQRQEDSKLIGGRDDDIEKLMIESLRKDRWDCINLGENKNYSSMAV